MARFFYNKEKDEISYHPGYYVQEVAEDKDTRKILLTGLGEQTLSDLIEGKIDVDRELANSLEICTGINKLTWLSIQESFDKNIKCKKSIEDTFAEEYKASAKDMLIIMTLVTLSIFPLLFIPLILALIYAPFFLKAEPANKIIYYMCLFVVMPLLLMLAKRLKDIFKNTFKYMISKLS